MLCELYTLKEIYANSNIFIWEINRDSMMVFAMFAYKRIDICGFVTTNEKFAGKAEICNRPVLGIKDLAQKSRSVVIMADTCKKEEVLKSFEEHKSIEVITYSDCLAVDYRLRDKKVILYGMGKESRRIRDILEENGIQVYGYTLTIVTEQDKALTAKKIYKVERLPQTNEIAVIIAVEPQNTCKWEMLEALERGQINNIYLSDMIVPAQDIGNAITFPLIDKVYKEKKKIYIYGQINLYGRMLEDVFRIYGIPFAGYVDFSSLCDISYDGFGDKFFVINEVQQAKMEKSCDELESLGLSLNNLAYTGIGWVNVKVSESRAIPDCLTGYMPLYTDFNGINIHGDKYANIRILVLGGSTSTTRYFRAKSWVDFLYERMSKEIGDVVIYNFANCGNDVVIELLKLLRDGYYVKPGYVISLSGVNNKCFKEWTINQFNVMEPVRWLKALDSVCTYNAGLEIKEELFTFWIRIQRIIKAVAEIYGAKYLGVLQPMDIGKKNKNLYETMVFEEDAGEAEENIKKYREQSREDDFYLNLLAIFDDVKENMYTDECHYTEKANKIIAEKIGDALLKIL